MDQVSAADQSRLIRVVVKQDKAAEFEEYWLETILPGLERSGVTGYQVFQTVFGGPSGEYWGTMPLQNFASLDGWAVLQGLSEADQARVAREFGELVDVFEINILALDRELSYGLLGL